MGYLVNIIGAGLAGSEAAIQLAKRNVSVRLFEMRPKVQTAVHHTSMCAELVCSNSLKSMKPESAAGMLKSELSSLDSFLLAAAFRHRVAAGGALAINRDDFAAEITSYLEEHPLIELIRQEVTEIPRDGDATIIASGPLTSETLARAIESSAGSSHLSFYDAAAPIVMADSLDYEKLFRQSRYEAEGEGDYLNAPFERDEYDRFIEELKGAQRVIMRDFETRDLFQACQPIEEIARKGNDAPRFGTLKPVGLIDPRTGRRPWAALQLRAEDSHALSYNLVGFQTNLTFPEQQRVFRMIPGLEKAEFARFGVMHRNTFIDAPRVLDIHLRMKSLDASEGGCPVYVAGQLGGTEGYSEAIMSGLWSALSVFASLEGKELLAPPSVTAFGSLLKYATNPATEDYQPMHVNFGIIEPLEMRIKNKKDRYAAYAARGNESFNTYKNSLVKKGIVQ